MILIRYDIRDKDTFDATHSIFFTLKEMYPDEEILAVPNEIDILFNSDINQLLNCRKEIDRIIRKKKQEEKEKQTTASK